jgi:hypothetical protein
MVVPIAVQLFASPQVAEGESAASRRTTWRFAATRLRDF